ncbi:MAG: dephospho-CoA kinase [Cytophagales bacterium CG12_big_fil_rev_8_21_14_0_65_40_12]|nr:MAG: dephospho-CoA kinase [Cytophagales bacterium CG12_big_fil_rev_8_21_14_0_65_40_12]PIW02974.1 MAG: dephospho-CoA kinase [Cytophagales bacterium CG17_big_fil_post_rev_8_21_14_2_50_40_13]
MNKPFLVGITGGIGSGKSTVCRIFETLGVPVYYADDRAKLLLKEDEVLRNEVISCFGKKSYLSNGGLNRVYLADRVFKVDSELQKLNSLVHPAVARDFQRWAQLNEHKILLKEAALLIENQTYKSMNYLITVLAPEKLRIERVLMRDAHRSKEQIRDILSKQVDDELRKSKSDLLVHNDGNRLLVPQVLKAFEKLQELALAKEGNAI